MRVSAFTQRRMENIRPQRMRGFTGIKPDRLKKLTLVLGAVGLGILIIWRVTQ